MKYLIVPMLALFLVTSACSAGTKEELFADGMQLMQQENYSGAIVVFRNALEKDQNYVEARYQLGRAYLELGRYSQAEQELRKVQLQSPNHPGLALDMARVYMHTERLEQAGTEAQQYVQTQPMSAEALVILGEIQGRMGELDQARETYRQALELQPDHVQAHLGMAKVHLLQNQVASADDELDIVLAAEPNNLEALYVRAEIQRRQAQHDDLLATYTRIAELSPQDVTTRYQKGLLLLDKDEIRQVEELAEQMQEKFPRQAEGYRLAGLKYFKEQNHAEAVVLLQQANSIQPAFDAHYFLGLSLHQTGELESALSQFRIILDRNPDFIPARLMTAMILMQQQRLDLAQAEAERVISRDPENAMAYNVLGSLLMAKGDFEQGMQALNRATQLNPELADAYFKQGVFHLGRGEGMEATTSLDAAIQVAPEQTSVRMLQFANLMQQGELDKAFATLEEGLKNDKSDAPLLNNMAAVRFAQNKPEEALELLNKAKSANPEFASAYYNLASFFQARGDLQQALTEYVELLKHQSDNLRALLSAAGLSAALGQNDQAEAYFARARTTNQPQAFLVSAEYQLRQGRPEEAKTLLDQGIAATTDNLPLKETKGRILMAQGAIDQAITLFEEISEMQPEAGLQLLAGAFLQKGDVQNAMAQAQTLIDAQPDADRGYLLLASIHETTNEPELAEEQIRAAIQAAPDSAQARFRLGSLKARQGDQEGAMASFTEAVEINPNFIPALFAQGNLLEARNEIPRAMELYQRILGINPNYVPALNNLAYLALKGHGSPEQALQLAGRAFRQEQNNPAIMDTLGLALLKNDQAEDGRRILERAAELLPDHPTVRFHLAMAYQMTGDPEMALEQVAKALEHDNFPEREEAQRMRNELEQSL